jgi:putative isomerase
VARHHPSIADNVYWRGRIWPILNWLTWLGLKRQKAWAAADSVVERGNRLFSPAWRQRTAPENFNAFHGAGLDQPDTDDFYSWTALLPYLESSRIVDIDPWSGWIAINAGPDARLGPMRSPWGMVTAERAKGRFRLVDQKSRVIFETRKKGRQPITADCRG